MELRQVVVVSISGCGEIWKKRIEPLSQNLRDLFQESRANIILRVRVVHIECHDDSCGISTW